MAYDSTIPALGNLISNDIPAMQENFSLLESAQVVDEGSTSDGYYIRWENGWQICISPWFDVDITRSDGDGYMSDDNVTWDFPQSFNITTEVSCSGSANRSNLWADFYQISNTQATGRGFGFVISDSRKIKSMAIGRWK